MIRHYHDDIRPEVRYACGFCNYLEFGYSVSRFRRVWDIWTGVEVTAQGVDDNVGQIYVLLELAPSA